MFLITGLGIKGNVIFCFVFRQEAGLRGWNQSENMGAERCFSRQLHALVEGRLPKTAASTIQGTASTGKRTRRPEGR